MGLLDTLTGMLGASTTTSNEPAVVLARKAFEVLQSEGGVQGLLQRFNDHGFANEVASWISTGTNLPISAADIQRVLGSSRVQEIARSAGVPTDIASGHLADVIPQIIDKLTPGGKVPDNSLLNGALDALRSSWGR